MSLPFSPVPDADLADLRQRLISTRIAHLPQHAGWERGTAADFLATLTTTWKNHFDWRSAEQRILDLPWTTAGQLNVVHQRATSSSAPTVVLLHGWPDSVLRFERVLPLLTDLNVVVPALPGFPFSRPLTETGMTVVTMASQVAEAMEALGYTRYVVSGGDVGTDIAEHLATLYPERVAALHLTNVSPLHAVFADRAALSDEALGYLNTAAVWQRAEGGYIAEQSTKPHTLAPALADSPAGLASWLAEKLHSWSETPFAAEDMLTWISVYWFTNTIGTSFAPYIEFAPPVPYVSCPTVLSAFAHDIKPAPQAFASHFVNVQEFIEHQDGGHFAAWEQPELYAGDLRRALALSMVAG